MHPAVLVCLVFAGCWSNVVFLELLVTAHPGCGNILTFSQFFFIAVEGLIFTSQFGCKKPKIPLLTHTKMTLLYLINVSFQSLLLHLRVDIPLQQLLRSGTLIANLILGVVILRRSYRLSKYVSILMISLGIGMATLASSYNRILPKELNGMEYNRFTSWLRGIVFLLCALLVSGFLGIYQEMVYTRHGKHATEALFYSHMLPLPVFLVFSRDIHEHVALFNASVCVSCCTDPVRLEVAGIEMPRMWLYLAGNVLSNYVCVVGVFLLSAECPSLTVNLVLTLRKFISLLISIAYFDNAFSAAHWIGTLLVFGGTLLFIDVATVFRRRRDSAVGAAAVKRDRLNGTEVKRDGLNGTEVKRD